MHSVPRFFGLYHNQIQKKKRAELRATSCFYKICLYRLIQYFKWLIIQILTKIRTELRAKSLDKNHIQRTCPVLLMRVARSFSRDCSWDPLPSSISNLALSSSLKSSSSDACSFLALRLERSRLNSYNQPSLIISCMQSSCSQPAKVHTSVYDSDKLMQ